MVEKNCMKKDPPLLPKGNECTTGPGHRWSGSLQLLFQGTTDLGAQTADPDRVTFSAQKSKPGPAARAPAEAGGGSVTGLPHPGGPPAWAGLHTVFSCVHPCVHVSSLYKDTSHTGEGILE